MTSSSTRQSARDWSCRVLRHAHAPSFFVRDAHSCTEHAQSTMRTCDMTMCVLTSLSRMVCFSGCSSLWAFHSFRHLRDCGRTCLLLHINSQNTESRFRRLQTCWRVGLFGDHTLVYERSSSDATLCNSSNTIHSLLRCVWVCVRDVQATAVAGVFAFSFARGSQGRDLQLHRIR